MSNILLERIPKFMDFRLQSSQQINRFLAAQVIEIGNS